MRRWAAALLVPKVLVANQTRVIEAVVDDAGAWLPGVPALTARPLPGVDRVGRRRRADVAGRLGVGLAPCRRHRAWPRGSVRLGPRWLAELPWPGGDARARGATRCAPATSTRCGRAVTVAYGVDRQRRAARRGGRAGLPRRRGPVPATSSQRALTGEAAVPLPDCAADEARTVWPAGAGARGAAAARGRRRVRRRLAVGGSARSGRDGGRRRRRSGPTTRPDAWLLGVPRRRRPGRPRARRGPASSGALSRSRTARPVTADDAYLTESIVDPTAQVVDGFTVAMPATDLTDDEVADLVAYIGSLAG